jgi:hypothetical protein
LKWKKLKCNGDVPTPRSGHSFTHVGSVNYILYGGIDNSKKNGGKIIPNNDIYLMKVSSSKYLFIRFIIQITLEEAAVPSFNFKSPSKSEKW